MRFAARLSTILLCLFLAGTVVSAATVNPGPGGYGYDPYVWLHVLSYETEEEPLPLVDEADEEWYWGGPPMVGSGYGYGNIQQGEDGVAKARSTIYHHSPYDDDYVSVGADVETFKPFKLTHPTRPNGETEQCYVSISYDGTLAVDEQMEGRYTTAYARYEVTLYDAVGGTLDATDGSANLDGFYSDPDDLTVTGDWVGNVTYDGTEDEYVVDFATALTFEGTIGETYYLYFDLATSATAWAGSPTDDWDTSQTFGESDFSNTATYAITSDDAGMGFEIVPEPATLALLGMGMAGLLLRRRR